MKSKAVRYLICEQDGSEFSVPVGNLERVEKEGVFLKRTRTAAPKNCARLCKNLPVYLETGEFLGTLVDLEMENFVVLSLITNDEKRHRATSVSGVRDAVIMKKPPLFPLGERLPEPFASFYDEPVVTRPVLKKVVERGELVPTTSALIHAVFGGKF